jgi:hypothetical protein
MQKNVILKCSGAQINHLVKLQPEKLIKVFKAYHWVGSINSIYNIDKPSFLPSDEQESKYCFGIFDA